MGLRKSERTNEKAYIWTVTYAYKMQHLGIEGPHRSLGSGCLGGPKLWLQVNWAGAKLLAMGQGQPRNGLRGQGPHQGFTKTYMWSSYKPKSLSFLGNLPCLAPQASRIKSEPRNNCRSPCQRLETILAAQQCQVSCPLTAILI